ERLATARRRHRRGRRLRRPVRRREPRDGRRPGPGRPPRRPPARRARGRRDAGRARRRCGGPLGGLHRQRRRAGRALAAARDAGRRRPHRPGRRPGAAAGGPRGLRRRRCRGRARPADLRHARRGPPPALPGRLRHGRLRRSTAGVRRAPARAGGTGPGRGHLHLPRTAGRRSDRRPRRARSADRRLAGDLPRRQGGRDAGVRRPADRNRPAGRHQAQL
ncbi:MAG: O-methyltransferase, partial [uncultured Blastococcus sp.]